MTEFTISPELDDASQYATVYYGDVPYATVQRARVYEAGAQWAIYNTDGRQIGTIWGSPRKETPGSVATPAGPGRYIDYAKLSQWIIRRVQNALVQGRI